jgi:group I intron endonuclease
MSTKTIFEPQISTEPISGIYCIFNVVTDKIYFGQSFDVENRLRKHKESLRRGTHYNDHLQKAFNKYGESNFLFSLFLECPESKRDFYEIKFIKDFQTTNRKCGYNIQSGGYYHKNMADETKQKLSDALKGRITNPQNHARLIETQKGENHPMWIKDFTIEDAVNDYQVGMTLEEIGKKHGVCTRTVWVRLKHSGIELTHASGLRPHKNYDVDGIVKDFQNGMSRRKLAIKYGNSRNTITKILKAEGVV